MVALQRIQRSLRLFVSDVPFSYKGKLYFVFGQGLGDTVNAFRILHEVMRCYPHAEPIVFADSRWSDLYRLIPELVGRPIRYYPEARVPLLSSGGTCNPYTQVFRQILDECACGSGLVPLGNFKLGDRWARKEPPVAAAARAIGLCLEIKHCRPYLPLSDNCMARAQSFLKSQGLSAGCYFAVAPHTWPDKMWEHEAWEILMASLHEATGLPVLLVGVRGYPSIKAPALREALELPLPVVAALIAQARCYIGLDTGLTHLAACFDVPIVTLNPQGKFPPFLVEPCSPFRWTHLTPYVYGSEPIPPASVFAVVQQALACSTPPACPACDGSPYVLNAQRGTTLFLCRCGLQYRVQGHMSKEDPLNPYEKGTLVVPVSVNGLASFRAYLTRLTDHGTSAQRDSDVSLTFEHWDPVETEPVMLSKDPTSRELWWTWDSVYSFLSRCGWQVKESRLGRVRSKDGVTFSVMMRTVPAAWGCHDPVLEVPWGGRRIQMKASTYERWLSWGAFRKQDDLEGIGWLLVNDSNVRTGLAILSMSLRLRPRWKTVSRLVRGGWKALRNPEE
ncbi:MAG: glycosyltransferase family 9 protein [Bacteroidota bacterium]